ncbi:MAG: NAD-dependent succinate-semialdehyde dehydrogenase [Myxococcales bacterium]|nr:NAD-dependent succinate-semialdehyde dehydrogenase [Myxococcales bacterium]
MDASTFLEAIDPTSGRSVRRIAVDSPSVTEAKLAASAQAFESWRERDFASRAVHLRKVAAVLRARAPELAARMTEEMGKTVREARGEIEKCAMTCEHFAEHAASYLAPEELPSDATRSWVQYLPLGPILGILPWNSPFWLAFRVCAPALMAGNTCLIKHDPHVPGCAQALAEVFEQAGVPEGVLQVLMLQTSAVEAVIRDRRVRAVSFTGSTRGGRSVAMIAASEIKPAVLELGGSDPCIILADADLEQAAEVVCLSRIIAVGQSCIAAKRLIIEAPVYDRFLQLLGDRMAALVVGDPSDAATDMGPMARHELRDVLHGQVTRSIEQGARCLLGGELPEGKGAFYPPTLLADLGAGSAAFAEETFGPVAAAARVDGEAQAIELANQTDYGLAGSFWTSPERGQALASRIEAGQIAINGIVKTDPRLPSGGIKHSGYGKELGPHGIREFVNAQQVWLGPKKG